MIKVAILDDYSGDALRLADWSACAQHCELVSFDRHISPDEATGVLQPFDVICTVRERASFGRPLLEALPKLKMITVADRRVRSIDIGAATEQGILVVEASPQAGLPTAATGTPEFAWGLILATVRHITAEERNLRAGRWQKSLGMVLAGRTLGLVGLGKVGTRVAQYGRAFDMDVIAWSENLTDSRASEAGVRRVDKDVLFNSSDIVSIHYVLSERSRGLVGAREISLMRRASYLVNTSRGGLVDEAALVAALSARRIAGAGLDVFVEEPLPSGHPLIALENVTLTPHLGFVTEEAMRRIFSGAATVVESYVRGAPTGIINPEALSHSKYGSTLGL